MTFHTHLLGEWKMRLADGLRTLPCATECKDSFFEESIWDNTHTHIYIYKYTLYIYTYIYIYTHTHIYIHIYTHIFIHLAVCLTTGPKPLPKPALHIARSRASSFKCEYPLLSLRSSNSFLRLLPCLPVTSIPPCIFPLTTRCRRQFLRKI